MVLALRFSLMCLTELNILLRFHVVLCLSFAIVRALWQWYRLEIGLVTLHWSAISQKTIYHYHHHLHHYHHR